LGGVESRRIRALLFLLKSRSSVIEDERVGRPGIPGQRLWDASVRRATRQAGKVRRMGNNMKNTGKRIFATIAFALLVSMPLIVSAGVHVSQR
jgi:hypothetical protein